MKHSQLRLGGVLVAILILAGVAGAASGIARPSRAAGASISNQTAIDWNKIAVSTVLSTSLSPTKFQLEGLIYMSYVQAAEYNAVTAISRPLHAV